MFKKILIIILVFSIVGIGFYGCRQKNPDTNTQDYTGIELTYYKVFDDADVIEPIISEYMADHPGLKIHYKKFADFSEYQSVILNEMAEGEGPDILSMQNTWFASNYKKVMPMPDSFGSPADFEETFVDTAYKDLVLVDEDGMERIFGVPMTVDTLAVYYNKDHYEDRIPARGKPAATWEGIKEDVGLLTKEDNSFDRFEVAGIAMGRSDNISRAVDILYLLFLQYGVDFYDDNISEAIFDHQQGGVSTYPGLDALEFFVSFADEDKKHYTWNEFVVDDNSMEKEIEAFARGDVSMIIGYAYTYDLILNQINVLNAAGVNTINEDAVRISAIPQIYDPSTSTEKRVTYASYFAEAVSRNSEHSDIAWDFLVFLTSKKNLDYYFNKLHKPTSRRDLIETQKNHPIYGVFVSQIGYAESFPILDYYRYKEIFEEVVFNANQGKLTVKALSDAADLINELLPNEGLRNPIKEIPEE